MIAFVALFVVFYLAAPSIAATVWRSVRRSWRTRGAGVAAAAGRRSRCWCSRASRRVAGACCSRRSSRWSPDRVAIVHGADGPAVFHRRLLRARHRSGVVVAIPDPGHAETALVTYAAFALLYLGVPQIARRRGAPLQPAARARRWCCCSGCSCCVISPMPSGRGRIVGARAAARDSECGAVHRERQRVAADTRAGRQPDFMGRVAGVVVRGGRRRRVVVVAARRGGPVAGHGRRIHLGPALCGTGTSGRAGGDGRAVGSHGSVAGAARTPVPVRGGGQLRLGGAAMAAVRRAGRGDARVQHRRARGEEAADSLRLGRR